MTACPRCQTESVGALPLCLACGHVADGPRRALRSVEVSEVDAREQARLVGVLRALEAQPFSLIEPVVESGSFTLRVHTSDLEQGRLEQALTALGVRFREEPGARDAGRYEVQWGLDPGLGAKLVVTASAIAAASWLDAPLVTAAGVVTAGALLLRAARVLPRELDAPDDAAGRYLGVVSDDLLAQLAAARPGLERRGDLAALTPSLGHFVELASLLRAGGALLLRPELLRIDQNLHELMRQVLRGVASAEPARPGDEAPTRHLSEVEQRLGSFVELLGAHGRQPRGPSAAVAPLSVLAELQAGIDQLAGLRPTPAR